MRVGLFLIVNNVGFNMNNPMQSFPGCEKNIGRNEHRRHPSFQPPSRTFLPSVSGDRLPALDNLLYRVQQRRLIGFDLNHIVITAVDDGLDGFF